MPAKELREADAADYVLDVIRGRKGAVAYCIRQALAVLAMIYTAGLTVYLFLYRIGIRRSTCIGRPVVCIGNITTGGTGKTPTSQMVCRCLMERGFRVAVLSRGYRGANEYGCALVSSETQLLLEESDAGDEAYLLATTLPGVPVAVGKDRIRTGRMIVERFQPDIVVLDDGMQHWRLHRDLDVALVNAAAPFDNGWTVPRGMLREPVGNLSRAGIVLITNAYRVSAEMLERVKSDLMVITPSAELFVGDLLPVGMLCLSDGVRLKPDWLQGRRVVAMSALGNPESFECTLSELGAVVTTTIRFTDHHAITPEELLHIEEARLRTGAELIVTTEKDAVKLPKEAKVAPIYVLHVAMQADNNEQFVDSIIRHLALDRRTDARRTAEISDG